MSHDPAREARLSGELAQARAVLARTRRQLLESDERLFQMETSDLAPLVEWLARAQQRQSVPVQLLVRSAKLLAWTFTGNLTRYLRADRRRRAEVHKPPVDLGNSSGTDCPLPPVGAAGAPRVLIVEHSVPKPDQNAGARYTLSIVRALRELGYAVFLWTYERTHGGHYTTDLEKIGVSVLDARWPGSLDDWLAENGAALDHVMTMWPRVSRDLLPAILSRTSCRISYHGHDLHHVRIGQQARALDDPLLAHTARRFLTLERQVWRTVDISIYLSDEEASEVGRLEPTVEARAIAPYAFTSFDAPSVPPATSNILFVGGFGHPPNGDAVHWFASEVFPAVRARHPSARFIVVGSNPTPDIRALAGPAIDVLGQIDDEALERAYAEARVAVAPLRFGAGVKGKVVEALAKGMPIVTTPIGVQGLVGLEHIIPVTASGGPMADAILELLTSDDLWRTQSRAQSAYAKENYSLDAMKRSLAMIL